MASVMVGSPASVHGKLHKRYPSDTPGLPRKSGIIPIPAVKRLSLDHKRMSGNSDSWNSDGLPQPPASPSSIKYRPHSKRHSTRDIGLVDLSRSITENESLTGLGLALHDSDSNFHSGEYGSIPRSVSDVPFIPIKRGRHIRTTSGGSQYSARTSGSFQRPPNAPHTHPMRQTPRPYTPPISRSITMSTGENSSDEDRVSPGAAIFPDYDDASPSKTPASNTAGGGGGDHSGWPDSTTSFPSVAATPSTAPDPMTRTSTASQNSLPQQGGSGRSRGATIQSIETTSGASSRPSLDKAMNFLRGQRLSSGACTEADIVVGTTAGSEDRTASIRAARAAYREREEAKERKAEKEELRQADRQRRRQSRREGRKSVSSRRTDEDKEGEYDAAVTAGVADEERDGESVGGEYATPGPDSRSHAPTHVRQLSSGRPDLGNDASKNGLARRRTRNAKSQRVIFIAWLRTRLLRMGTS